MRVLIKPYGSLKIAAAVDASRERRRASRRQVIAIVNRRPAADHP
jgi:hypothetical protein